MQIKPISELVREFGPSSPIIEQLMLRDEVIENLLQENENLRKEIEDAE